jgi:hypothetical protein
MEKDPIWISNRLETYFTNKVLVPWNNPQIYHAKLAPIPYCQAIVGRQGVGKLETLQSLIESHGISSWSTISVEFGKTMEAIQAMSQIFEKCREQSDRVGYAVAHILVIDHADILCYEPDNETSLLAATKIATEAKSSRCMVLAICDRAKGTGHDQTSSSHITAWARACQAKFFQQFDSVGFAPAPNAEMRVTYLKWAIDLFQKHLEHNGRKLMVEIEENDWKMIEDYTTYATQEHLHEWLQQVFMGILEDGCRIILNLDFMVEYLSTRMGAPHVCTFDARAVEDMYSSAAGGGPIAPVPKYPFEEKKKEGPIVVSGFSEGNVDLDEAKQEISEKKSTCVADGFGMQNEDEFAPAHAPAEQEEKSPKPKKASKKRSRKNSTIKAK